MPINHLLLIFKFHIYSARNTKQLNFNNLKKTIKNIKELEKELTGSNKLKLLKKWLLIDHIIDWYYFQSENGDRLGTINFISRLFFFFLFFFVVFFFLFFYFLFFYFIFFLLFFFFYFFIFYFFLLFVYLQGSLKEKNRQY